MIYGILVLCLLFACSKSDDVKIAAPELMYNQNRYTTLFYDIGNSAPPTIDWNGDVGQFGLENVINGISIDSNTGIISWNKIVPLGENSIKVLAFNNAGTTLTTILLQNEFAGNFKGPYSPVLIPIGATDFLVAFNFMENGTLTGVISHTDVFEVVMSESIVGTWTIDGNEINGEYFYEQFEDSNPLFIHGLITYSPTEASIEGRFGSVLDHPEFSRPFEVDLVVQ